jgi:CBS domain-containing protein
METDLPVSDIMSRDLITADIGETADRLGKTMVDASVGCIIILKGSHPVGIVTESDLVDKVISRNFKPSTVKAGEIMSTPLITISPEKSVELASREMVKRGIRRMPVVQNNRLVGLVSASDLLSISSELSEILRDLIMQNNPHGEFSEKESEGGEAFIQGICEVCQSFKESLVNIDGVYVCSRCREELPNYQ